MSFDSEHYDVAQICLNGHVINDSTQEFPESNKKFCQRCGEKTVTECQNCRFPIRGDYKSTVVVIGVHYKAPAYCENCGSPYEWTARTKKAAEDLANEATGLSAQERGEIVESLDDLAHETPQSKSKALKVKQLLGKAGGTAGGMLRDLVVDVSSEAVKKILLGS